LSDGHAISEARETEGEIALRESAAVWTAPQLTLLILSGPDAKGWLQGQVTNDLRDLPAGGSMGVCFTKTTGQILDCVRVFEQEGRLFIPTLNPDVLTERVRDFVIMEDVTLTVYPGMAASIQGPAASSHLRAFMDLPPLDVAVSEDTVLLRHDRSGQGGWDLFGAVDTWLEGLPRATDLDLSSTALEVGRVMTHIDADARTLPPELGDDFARAHVSHTKGCYVGQEILHRIYSRGHTNRTWRKLQCAGPVAVGDDVTLAGESLGTVSRAHFSPDFGWIACGILRNRGGEVGRRVQVGTSPAEIVDDWL
jgi:folate-binding protein YgfZ